MDNKKLLLRGNIKGIKFLKPFTGRRLQDQQLKTFLDVAFSFQARFIREPATGSDLTESLFHAVYSDFNDSKNR